MATSINPEFHLVPCINVSFKVVVALPKNAGLEGLQKTEVQPLQCKMNPVK